MHLRTFTLTCDFSLNGLTPSLFEDRIEKIVSSNWRRRKMKQKQKLISIIMPVRNGGRFLVEAIDSIRAQSYVNWEMIVVNDGSTDNTTEILADFSQKDNRIKVITNKKSAGIGASLNKALRQAQGHFVARMDGDDISLPNRLALQVDFLEKNKAIVAVGGQAEMIDDGGVTFAFKKFPTDKKILRDMIMWMVPMQHPVMMVRASAYKKCHYDEKMSTAEDVDLMMQLLRFGEFGNVDEVVYRYRKADTSNGYHNVKKTFYLTLLSRLRGILQYGYKPSVKGVMLSLAQLGLVSLLPSKWVVRLYESRRFTWVKEHVFRILSGISAIARATTLL